MKQPKVTVIIPTYNQQDLIIRTLLSIPDRPDIEVIVVDDKSTDTTAKQVEIFMEHSTANIRLLKNSENKGVGYTTNRGLDAASGEYIVLIGSDDYFYADGFTEAMEELDGTDLVYFNLQLNDGYIWQLNDDTKHGYCGSTKFMRRAFIGNTRNPEMRAREDYYFYKELMAKQPSEKFTGITVKHYNFPREGSLTWVACNGFKEEK